MNLLEILKPELLNEYFENKKIKSGEILFDENEQADKLILIRKGDILISKATNSEKTEFKELAILSEGDFIGEISLFETGKRTARALVLTDCEIYEISKENFLKLINTEKDIAINMLFNIIRTISVRLAHTSKELTLLFDISKLLVTNFTDEKEFIKHIINEISIYFNEWEIEGYYYNYFNAEFEKVHEISKKVNTTFNIEEYKESKWINNTTFILVSKIESEIVGTLIFISNRELSKSEINNFTTIFNTISYIMSSGIKNTRHNKEIMFMNKLKEKKQGL